MKTKICNKCGSTLSLDMFHKDSYNKDGLSRWCKSCNNLASSIYHKNNREKRAAKFVEWEIKNPNKRVGYNKKWKINNPNKVNQSGLKRFQKLRAATPIWLTKAEKREIELFIKNCPVGYVVDHIIPIRSEDVCGLNILTNMQYLKKEENRFKSNKFDFTNTNESWKIAYAKRELLKEKLK